MFFVSKSTEKTNLTKKKIYQLTGALFIRLRSGYWLGPTYLQYVGMKNVKVVETTYLFLLPRVQFIHIKYILYLPKLMIKKQAPKNYKSSFILNMNLVVESHSTRRFFYFNVKNTTRY